MINCRKATELHTAAEEGAIDGVLAPLYALHMKVCGPCKRYRAQLHATVELLRDLPKEEPPQALLDLLSAEIFQAHLSGGRYGVCALRG